MKQSTTADKLKALLGIAEEVKHSFEDTNAKKKKTPGLTAREQEIEEEEIESFRAAQGILYFFRAPELFTAKVCKHCGESFLVSRKHVAYCSYTCIDKELLSRGIEWSRRGELTNLVTDPSGPYQGQEPIWIKNLDRIQAVLNSIKTPTAV